MNFERFEREFSSLANLFKKEGFFREPSSFETDLYGKFLDYNFGVKIIVSRLEHEINEFASVENAFLEPLKKGHEFSLAIGEALITCIMKITLDLSDFYIHTRIFLDTINTCIKHSFRSTGNKNWNVMTNSISGLLNEKKMQTYEKQIDSQFFEGLKSKISWIYEFRDSRDRLLHQCHHFVFTNTRQSEMGYDLIGKVGSIWGTETVKPVLIELQRYVDNISDLMNYLHNNLPRVEQKTKIASSK
jgi:hypothetical protein